MTSKAEIACGSGEFQFNFGESQGFTSSIIELFASSSDNFPTLVEPSCLDSFPTLVDPS